MVIVRADKHRAFTFERIRAKIFGKPVDYHSWIKSISWRSLFKTYFPGVFSKRHGECSVFPE